GDAISYVMQTEGASFPEAVERLAGEAGLEVPRPAPAGAEAERARRALTEVLEAAATSFARRLHAPEGRAALGYLRGRGLTEDTIASWSLGWSGEGRGALALELAGQGITPAQLVAAGVMKEGERGTVDFFFNRVMFPIRDGRGRMVSFGGRVLGEGQPKYLNGPETEIFAKRRTLFGLDRARTGVREGGALIVVEGYLDVISLHGAGFAGAVAPLGTALTEEQLAALWSLAPRPVLCFDADAAGGRACLRAIERALPLLTPERSLEIALLPAGEDPDSLVRARGRAGFEAALTARRPLAEALYDLLRAGQSEDSPEARAAFLARIEQAAGRIADRSLSREYLRTLRDRYFASRRGPRGRVAGLWQRSAAPAAMTAARPRPDPAETERERGRVLTALLLACPALAAEVEEELARVRLSAACEKLCAAILDWEPAPGMAGPAMLLAHLQARGLSGEAEQIRTMVALPPLDPDPAGLAEARRRWRDIMSQIERAALAVQLGEVQRRAADNPDDAGAWSMLPRLREEMLRADQDDEPEPGTDAPGRRQQT
ncbi:MAG: DNA primase, partial [Acetobacteraceae bacterium]